MCKRVKSALKDGPCVVAKRWVKDLEEKSFYPQKRENTFYHCQESLKSNKAEAKVVHHLVQVISSPVYDLHQRREGNFSKNHSSTCWEDVMLQILGTVACL